MSIKTWNDVTALDVKMDHDSATNSTTVHVDRTFAYINGTPETEQSSPAAVWRTLQHLGHQSLGWLQGREDSAARCN